MPTEGSSEGARSIWYDDISTTCTRPIRGGSSDRIAVPIFPPIWVSKPATLVRCAIKAVVVDLPLVPVMATNGASGACRRRSRQNSSMSPITSIAASRAFNTLQCGTGWVRGTPGASTSAAKLAQETLRKSAVMKPACAALATFSALSSAAITSAPPAFKAWQDASPEPPRPNTATVLPAKDVTGIIDRSPQLQRGQAGQRQHHRDDPEADHDLRLGPAELLEMMMDRRHLEDALTGQLEGRDLHDHRDGFEHEQAADHRQHDLVLHRDRDRAKHAAERQRAGVAHEDRGRRRIEPEEAEPSAEHCATEHGELAGARDVVDLQIVGEHGVAGEVGDQAKARRGDHHRHDRKAVEAVGQVDGIAGTDDDEGTKENVEPAELEDEVLEERNCEPGRGWVAAQANQRVAGDQRDRSLDHQAKAAGKPRMRLLGDLQVVVIEADEAEAERDRKHDPDVRIERIGPQHGRDDESRKDHQAAHRGRALLADDMGLRAIGADRLALALAQAKVIDNPGAEQEHEQCTGDHGAAGPEGDVTEHVEEPAKDRQA